MFTQLLQNVNPLKLHEYCHAVTILSCLRQNRYFEGAQMSDLQMNYSF